MEWERVTGEALEYLHKPKTAEVCRMQVSDTFSLIRMEMGGQRDYEFDTGLFISHECGGVASVVIDLGTLTTHKGRGKKDVIQNMLNLARELRLAAEALERMVAEDQI